MKTIFSILILVLLTIVSCKKDNTLPVSIAGYWSGIGVDNTSAATPLGFLYRTNGTARVYSVSADTNVADKNEATYSIDADSIRTVVNNSGTITTLSAKLNNTATQMDGTFRRTTISYHGTYSVTKQ